MGNNKMLFQLQMLKNNVKEHINYSRNKKEEFKYKNEYLAGYYEGKEAAYEGILIDIISKFEDIN